eukprot:3661001-Rhodomonas_salina.1
MPIRTPPHALTLGPPASARLTLGREALRRSVYLDYTRAFKARASAKMLTDEREIKEACEPAAENFERWFRWEGNWSDALALGELRAPLVDAWMLGVGACVGWLAALIARCVHACFRSLSACLSASMAPALLPSLLGW